MNQVGLVGRITKDPELKYYNEKRPFTTFTLAVNRHFKNQHGNYEADFVQCSAWGKLAESITNKCGKGSLIGINGRLNSRSYINKENEKVYTMDVTVESVKYYILKDRQQEVDLSEFISSEKKASIVAESSTPLENTTQQLPIPS